MRDDVIHWTTSIVIKEWLAPHLGGIPNILYIHICSHGCIETVQFLSYEEQHDRLIIPEFGIGRVGLSSPV